MFLCLKKKHIIHPRITIITKEVNRIRRSNPSTLRFRAGREFRDCLPYFKVKKKTRYVTSMYKARK